MLRNYECTILLRQDLSKAQVEQAQADFIKLLTEAEGSSTSRHEYWGLKSLAYPIKKMTKAHYVFFNAVTDPAAIIEMERQMRIREDIVRYLNVKVKVHSEKPSPMAKGTNLSEERESRHNKKDVG